MRVRLPLLINGHNASKLHKLLEPWPGVTPGDLLEITGGAEERLRRTFGDNPADYHGAGVDAAFPLDRARAESFAALAVRIQRRRRGWCLESIEGKAVALARDWELRLTVSQGLKLARSAAHAAGLELPLAMFGSYADPTPSLIAGVALSALHFREIDAARDRALDECDLDIANDAYHAIGLNRETGPFVHDMLEEIFARSNQRPADLVNQDLNHPCVSDFVNAAKGLEVDPW